MDNREIFIYSRLSHRSGGRSKLIWTSDHNEKVWLCLLNRGTAVVAVTDIRIVLKFSVQKYFPKNRL